VPPAAAGWGVVVYELGGPLVDRCSSVGVGLGRVLGSLGGALLALLGCPALFLLALALSSGYMALCGLLHLELLLGDLVDRVLHRRRRGEGLSWRADGLLAEI